MFQKKSSTFVFSFAISLGFHFFLFQGFNIFYLNKEKKNQKKASLVEFQFISEEEKEKLKKTKYLQVVDQIKNPLNRKIPEKTKYLSQFHQKVEKEMKASRDSLAFHRNKKNQDSHKKEKKSLTSQYASPHSLTSSSQPNLSRSLKSKAFSKPSTKNLESLSFEDLKPSFYKKGASLSSMQKVWAHSVHSKSLDALKNIQEGHRTLLNTRKFVYYSYYERIKEKLKYYWDIHLTERVKMARNKGAVFDLFQSFTTRVIAILDANGSLTHIQVIGKSGLLDLDEAALNAFHDAGPFPNPPKGMVNPEGQVRIYWDFVLEKS